MPKLLIIAIVATWYHCSIAHHDPRCNPENTKVCVDSEMEGDKISLRCVDSRRERTLPYQVTWLKNSEVYQTDDRVHDEDHPHHRLVFEEVRISDEGNWTCSNGSLSPEFKFYGSLCTHSLIISVCILKYTLLFISMISLTPTRMYTLYSWKDKRNSALYQSESQHWRQLLYSLQH